MKYCITKLQNKIVSFLMDESGHAVEIHADEEEGQELLGNIYIGRVQNVVKNLQAAFVEIEPGKVCYLPLEDLKDPVFTKKGPSKSIQQGDELVVQVSREAIKTKAPSVSTNLCLQGRYVVLDRKQTGVGISKKLPEEQRSRLKQLVEAGLAEKECKYGMIVRTNAAEAGEAAILAELKVLDDRLTRIQDTAKYRTCFSCLYRTPLQWLKRIDSIPWGQDGAAAEHSSIVVEDAELQEQLQQYLEQNHPDDLVQLVHYQDALLPMVKLYSLEKELKEALLPRVWLRSGGYLIIQPTEALTVVDVNTGKFEGEKKKEAAVLKVNLEAARETARQLRLRNLSGIIIVDFINMTEEASKKQLIEVLKQNLLMDPVPARFVDITKLELVEITRKKIEKPLEESMRS
ncbi:MAG: ribonuclease E/G [Lachnospiraceae bacterium]|nr:ribonuclease E/G [Lachnospiraceae bacterium]